MRDRSSAPDRETSLPEDRPDVSALRYQVGGSLHARAPSYVARQADADLYDALRSGEFAYVLSARQMGKSSLLVRARSRLEADGDRVLVLDITGLGSRDLTPAQWYKGIATRLWAGAGLADRVDLKAWWRSREDLPLVQRLGEFVEEILRQCPGEERWIVLVDEVDSVLALPFAADDFFAWIRYCYNRRAIDPQYNRIGFALFGVATPSELIADRRRTPFNIGRAIALEGFARAEATPLLPGLAAVLPDAEATLDGILRWTGGQPFLTQKLCALAVAEARKARAEQPTAAKAGLADADTGSIPDPDSDLDPDLDSDSGPDSNPDSIADTSSIPDPDPGAIAGAERLDRWVRDRLLDNWEFQDEPEHLRTIRDRLLRNPERVQRLLTTYAQTLDGCNAGLDSRDRSELLLSGLVVARQGKLLPANPIYAAVFDRAWIAQQLAAIRPYSQAIEAWAASGQRDDSRLLRGAALDEARHWAQGRSLAALDYQFLAQSERRDRQETRDRLEADRLRERSRLQRRLLAAVSVGLAASIALGAAAYVQFRQARIGEIEALLASAEGRFDSDRRLDSLLQAIQARRAIDRLGVPWADRRDSPAETLRERADRALQLASLHLEERNRFSGHANGIDALAVSPATGHLLSGDTSGQLRLWSPDGQLRHRLDARQAIRRIAAHPTDPNVFAVGLESGEILLWAPDSDEPPRRFQALGRVVSGLDYSSDGRWLTAVSFRHEIGIFQADGTPVKTFSPEPATFTGTVFVPDRDEFWVGSHLRGLSRWDVAGNRLQTLPWTDDAPLYSLAIAPDGTIAAGSSGGRLFLWRSDGTPLRTIDAHEGPIEALTFDRDGRTLFSAGDGPHIKRWTLDGRFLHDYADHREQVRALAPLPDGSGFASTGNDRTVRLWRFDNPLAPELQATRGAVCSLAFRPAGENSERGNSERENHESASFEPENSERKISDRENSESKISETGNSGAEKSETGNSETENSKGQISAIAISEASRSEAFSSEASRSEASLSETSRSEASRSETSRSEASRSEASRSEQFPVEQPFELTTATNSGRIRQWDLATRLPVAPDWQQALVPIDLDWVGGDRYALATGGTDLILLDRDGQPHWQKPNPNGYALSVRALPGDRFLVGSNDGTVARWRADGTREAVLPFGQQDTWDVEASADGRVVAAGTLDGAVRLWRDGDAQPRTLGRHGSLIRDVALSPQGDRLATAGANGQAKLWTLDGQAIATLDVGGDLWGGDFSPDGRAFATGRKRVSVFAAADGAPLATLAGHRSNICEIKFSPGGRWLASGDDGGVVRLWDWQAIAETDFLAYGCGWLQDYLAHNGELRDRDRALCRGVRSISPVPQPASVGLRQSADSDRPDPVAVVVRPPQQAEIPQLSEFWRARSGVPVRDGREFENSSRNEQIHARPADS